MDYEGFAERFLAALYLETEETGRELHSVTDLSRKYRLKFKEHWIARLSDDWEHKYFRDVLKVLGGYGGWNFRISAAGARKVEGDFRDENHIRDFLTVDRPDEDLSALSNRLAPASDRIVRLDDNRALVEQLEQGISEIERTIISSNELDADEKSDVLISQGAAKSIFTMSKAAFVGAFRYLVLDRIKKAFESALEDAFRVLIIGVLGALVAAILPAL